MSADRLVTLVVLLISLGLIFVVIPKGAEHVETGVMSPDGVPLLLAWTIAVLALIQFVNPFVPAPEEAPDGAQFLRAMGMLALAAVCAWVMPLVGFLAGAVALATGANLMMQERRPAIVLASGLVAPLAIWAIVRFVLERPLP